jgi:hypothetical protein
MVAFEPSDNLKQATYFARSTDRQCKPKSPQKAGQNETP